MEVLTLNQTGKHDPVPVVFLDAPGGTYWKTFDAFLRQELLGGQMISPDDTALYMVTDDCEAAVQECTKFNSVYHSMRYLGDQLALRLRKPLSEAALTHIRTRFEKIRG